MARSTSKLFKEEAPKELKEDAMNLPDEETSDVLAPSKTLTDELEKEVKTPAQEEPDDDIQDINLEVIQKKRFRINGDKTRILELNTSDLTITSRLSTAYDKLVKCMDKVGKVLAKLPEGDEEDAEEKEKVIAEQLKAIDDEMRKQLDYIFDAPVSEVCGYGGSMYDPFNGMFRFEHIIDAISKLYETNLNNEFSKMRKRVNEKTAKYTKKYHN